MEFHVHINASQLAIEPIVYASQFLNHVERNYTTIEHEALAMV
jgi:hypothetical protein